MSHLLWRAYWQDDVERFRRLLAPGGHNTQTISRASNLGHGTGSGGGAGSPGALGTSPRFIATPNKNRKPSGQHGTPGGHAATIGKAEVNSRDHMGLTLLLRAASSNSENALAFVRALLEHPAVDIYIQDPESGWNALHRALYHGNISIARLLLAKERRDITDGVYKPSGAAASRIGHLIKTKDHEGNSPFELFAATVSDSALDKPINSQARRRDAKVPDEDAAGSDTDESTACQASTMNSGIQVLTDGDEIFSFGSNKNMSLGVGDESDRQYPERLHLRRPDHLLYRFYSEYLEEAGIEQSQLPKLENLPVMVLMRPLVIHDVVLSKFHSAVITTDPVSNLYICGIGRGGRLGLSDDQRVRFTYVPVQGGLADRKVTQVALGQDHTMAVTENGELWTWGLNSNSQLGYVLPPPAKKDEEPMSLSPKQVFGALKKEMVIGVAASAIHSVAHTANSLFCWGKNLGQLALMDADSRSLEVQQTPRKVAASLFPAPIVMVSAIDKATTVLLQNHVVCVFTSYGYNMVKFPAIDPFANCRIQNPAMVLGYEAGKGQRISHITSGGDTVAAVTSRGDLFVMGLNHDVDVSSSASTTNPNKIRSSVGQPQCIWRAWKEGVKSVGVGSHGSVIIATESGAVWRRVKRATAKDAYVSMGAEQVKRKDYKFQRVPYISNVVTVRSSMSGAFAAIRRDSPVMKQQLAVTPQTIWEDLDALLPLHGITISKSRFANESHTNRLFGQFVNDDSDTGRVVLAVLQSLCLSTDLAQHLDSLTSDEISGTDVFVSSSSYPELRIPCHGWLLSARSPTICLALAEYRACGTYSQVDSLAVEAVDGKASIIVESSELLTIINLVLFAYTDRISPAWNIRQPSPSLTQASRQQRVELMKVAAKLGITRLEAAARMQNNPSRSLAADIGAAIKDAAFFDDGDVLLELDGGEAVAHSSLLCQRCPYFNGLYNGRSSGMWLSNRREDTATAEMVRIDMKHFEPEPFAYVLRYLYSDAGEELFDETVTTTFDDFTDLIMDVMAIANELMLDRLSEICQKVMGRFVTTRTVAHFLNEISPCSVTEFKDAGLNYICVQMETMLENHLLDDLDEDILLELDEKVKENQALFSAKCDSGDRLLAEHPELTADIEEERMIRVKEMAYRSVQRDDEKKLSASFKGRAASLEDGAFMATPEKLKRKAVRNEPFSPSLRPQNSAADLMFDMDEDEEGKASPVGKSRPQPGSSIPEESSSLLSVHRRSVARRSVSGGEETPPRHANPAPSSPTSATSPSAKLGSPWQQKPFVTSKLDLRDIMTEDSRTATSALTQGLAAQKQKEMATKPVSAPQAQVQKMSQKQRKKQQQMQAALVAQESSLPNRAAWEEVPGKKTGVSPWKPTPVAEKVSLTEALAASQQQLAPAPSAAISSAKPLIAAESSPRPVHRRTASPDTRFAGQPRTPKGVAARSPQPSSPLVPHSKSYVTKESSQKAEPTLGLSMADIIGQQRREQELVKEAVAKRSLQEIQQEQEFQSWWDQESQRIQEEERRRAALSAARDKGARGEGPLDGARGGRSRRGGRFGGKNRGGSNGEGGGGGGPSPAETKAASGRKPRGRGRGRGDGAKA